MSDFPEFIPIFTEEARSPEETERVARKIYETLLKEHPLTLLLLEGELGAGKTTFCKGLGAALGIRETVNSPTFNLLNRYEGEEGLLYHYDLYRIGGGEELYDLGFVDYWSSPEEGRKAVHAIEWWERAVGYLPGEVPTFLVRLEYDIFEENPVRRIHVYRVT